MVWIADDAAGSRAGPSGPRAGTHWQYFSESYAVVNLTVTVTGLTVRPASLAGRRAACATPERNSTNPMDSLNTLCFPKT